MIATVLVTSCVRGEVGALINQLNSSVMCVFPGAWRSVLEGGCREADVRKASGQHGDQDSPDIKAERDELTLIHTAGALLILKHFLQQLTEADSARE